MNERPEFFCRPCGREHQPREREIPCQRCLRNKTIAFHGICGRCLEEEEENVA